MMILLIDSGAKMNAKDSDFLSPLYQAVVYGRTECQELRNIVLWLYGASACNSERTIGHLHMSPVCRTVSKCHMFLERPLVNIIL